MKDLLDIRKDIDKIDEQIVKLYPGCYYLAVAKPFKKLRQLIFNSSSCQAAVK